MVRRSPRSLTLVLFASLMLTFLTAVAAPPAAVAVVPGTVVGWGSNGYGQGTPPASLDLTDAVDVVAGGYHSVALKADGTVVSWGGATAGLNVIPAGLGPVVDVAAGTFFSLVAKADGTVVAWGSNSNGQTTVPPGLSGVVAVAAGDNHSLALKANGTVVAWGSNSMGQTNVPAGLDHVVAIAGGSYHSIALKDDGTVVAWGSATYGGGPVPAGLSGVTAIAAGWYHNLAVRADGTVVSWGYDVYGSTNVPAGLTGVVAVAGGEAHSLALKANGTVVAWGWNQYNQATVPFGLERVQAISAGVLHSLALVAPADVTAPVLDVPDDLSVLAASASGAAVDFTVTATDETDPSPTVTCTPPSGSVFPVGTTTVTCTATDDSDNTATETFQVTVQAASADVSIEKSVDPALAGPGERVAFTLRVHNAGPGTAEDVQVTDLLPAGLTYVGDTAGSCSLDGRLLTCEVGPLGVGATWTATVNTTVDPVTANTRHQHDLGVTKVEAHLTLGDDATDTATATCPTGYLVTDGSVRIDAVDQDTGTLDDVMVLDSRPTTAGNGWTGRVHNTAGGQAQVKVIALCVSAKTVSGEDHAHPLVVSTPGPAHLSFDDAGSQQVERTCPVGSMAIAPSHEFTTGDGVVGTRRTATGWRFTVTTDGPAQVAVAVRCLDTALGAAAGHRHELSTSEVQGVATVPAGAIVERSLTCPVGAKGIVAWADLGPGLVSLGTDPQPITRLFRFANPTGTAAEVDYGLVCLDIRTWDGTTTNTASVSTTTPDADGTAGGTDTATFVISATGVVVGPKAHVTTDRQRPAVRVRLTSSRPRTVQVKLLTTAPVPQADLPAGALLARIHDVRLEEGRQTLSLTALDKAVRALLEGWVSSAKVVVIGPHGQRTIAVVQLD